MRSNFQIGIIGKGSQFKRVSKILKKLNLSYFLYKPNNKKYYDKNQFIELKKCKFIFILSPNNSHYYYIKTLHKNRYIFCEKPPISTKTDFVKIKKINHKKIFFNFNLRFSKLAEVLTQRDKYKLGELLYGNIISGHGLAFKKEYSKSWRSDKKFCRKGVFEISSVHWIDLLNYFFGLKKLEKLRLSNFLKKGNSFDNSYCKITLGNNSEVDIFSSYSSPLIKKIMLVFTNGVIEQNEAGIEVRGPSKNFNKKGFFIKPKIIRKIRVNEVKDFEGSIEKSVKFFLKIANLKKNFSKREFTCSLKSNELIL
tara:strand:+ start:548 stop:1477 length:930 start_codon:yes stop_codon:yes gene_type:complete